MRTEEAFDDRERRLPAESKGMAWLVAGALLWLTASVVSWPSSVSFEDEVGYIGEARLLLEGRVRPLPESPGIWTLTEKGSVSKFSLLISLLVAPLFAITPRLVFASGIAAALGLTFVVARVLRAWGRNPAWALVVLAHPTIIMISRTVMADLLLATFSVTGWWLLRSRKCRPAMLFMLLIVATKATGSVIACALLMGEALRCRRDLLRFDRETVSALAWGALGVLGGAALTLAANLITTGRVWFAYGDAHRYIGTPSFWPPYFTITGPVHLTWVLLLPPMLIVGAWPFWRRREMGPLLVIFGLGLLMCFYFFVDHGRTTLETLVLSPRLLLPTVAFLLLGYADMAAGLALRFSRAPKLLLPAGILLVATCSFVISRRHAAWQQSNAAALSAASQLLAETGGNELGLTGTALKAGILASANIVMAGVRDRAPPKVVLCNTQSPSYRAPGSEWPCLLRGYEESNTVGTFRLLVRRQP